MRDIKDTLAQKYPAKTHAKNVVDFLKQKESSLGGVIYLEGQKTRMIEDNDEAQPFRQRRFFYYLSGCNEPDCSLLYDIGRSHLTLFIPPLDPDEVIWSGLPLSTKEAKEKYDVDEVRTTSDVNAYLAGLPDSSKAGVYTIANQVSEDVTFQQFGKNDSKLVKEAIEESRIFKDEYEVALTIHANKVSAQAHAAVMKAAKHAQNERELEALFLQKCISVGCREQAYHSIVASGQNAATLHYLKNTDPLKGRWNILLDAGAEYECYASDITRTFPISGKFNHESRQIYDLVLHMQKECIGLLKANVQWEDVHVHAHRLAIEGLLKIGILKDGTAQEIFEARTSVAFLPHGLGHFLGMNTHDTGGHPNYSDKDPMFRYLRVRRKLPAGSIITVEPGIYFCKFIIDPYLEDPKHAKYIDRAVLDKYWPVGGVRIEDDILITENGYENLTSAVKEVDEMEQLARE